MSRIVLTPALGSNQSCHSLIKGASLFVLSLQAMALSSSFYLVTPSNSPHNQGSKSSDSVHDAAVRHVETSFVRKSLTKHTNRCGRDLHPPPHAVHKSSHPTATSLKLILSDFNGEVTDLRVIGVHR